MISASIRRQARIAVAFLAFSLAAFGPVLAAISPTMVWEIQTGGNDTTNSGGFRGGAFIAAPAAPTVAASAGGSVAAATYYCVITYTDYLGDTVISGQTAVTTDVTNKTITVTSPSAATEALTWNVYFGTVSGGPYFPEGTGLLIGTNRVRTTTPPTTGAQPRGVDRSLGTTRFMVLDNSAITATTAGAASNVITFTGYTPTGADVGNTFRATAGTNINVGDYEITAVTTTTWTVTGAANLTTGGGAGAAIVGGMGGCFATPGQAAAFAISGNIIYAKNGTYTIGSGTVNTAGNKVSINLINLIGYNTNRVPMNTDTLTVFDAGAASMDVLTFTGLVICRNISFTNSASRASVISIRIGNNSNYQRISVSGGGGVSGSGAPSNTRFFDSYFATTAINFQTGTRNQVHRCVFAGGSDMVMANNDITDSIFISPAPSSFTLQIGNFSLCRNVTIYGATGANGTAFNLNSSDSRMENCLAYGNSKAGFINVATTDIGRQLYNCASGGNSPDFTGFSSTQMTGCVTLTADPFTNAAANDFSLNTTAGGGAACRAAGIPGAFFGLGTTTGYRDVGAVQSSSAAGSGPTFFAR